MTTPNLALDRTTLRKLLSDWKAGLIGEVQVQESAEALLDARQPVDELPQDDDRSVPLEVLLYLDALPALLITKEDVDTMLAFLDTPPGHAAEGRQRWSGYWETIDGDERRESLRGNPFYFT